MSFSSNIIYMYTGKQDVCMKGTYLGYEYNGILRINHSLAFEFC